jgi:cyanophycin synthetase
MADLAGRLDVRGRRIVVVAGPGDRRDEDLRAIALAVAGRFDHYVCRRDDGLRGRAPDEVPQMIAATLREQGVPDSAISLIPDEQQAIDAALRMGRPGDLLLVFADALTRSWKQIIKFKPEAGSTPAPGASPSPAHAVAGLAAAPAHAADGKAGPAGRAALAENAAPATSDDGVLLTAGFVRDERGLRFVGEASD